MSAGSSHQRQVLGLTHNRIPNEDDDDEDNTDANTDHHSFVLTFSSTLFLTPNSLYMKNDAW